MCWIRAGSHFQSRNRFAKSMFAYLMNLGLADSADGSQDLEMDLLIGTDFTHLLYLDHAVFYLYH